MADTLTPEERSERMSRIRSRDTEPEVALRSMLHRMGFRFRVDVRNLPGRPDMVLRKHRAIIFVHGCFWHRHMGCKIATTPKSNTEFWVKKFERNVERDRAAIRKLNEMGWKVIVAWECELKNAALVSSKARQIARQITEGE